MPPPDLHNQQRLERGHLPSRSSTIHNPSSIIHHPSSISLSLSHPSIHPSNYTLLHHTSVNQRVTTLLPSPPHLVVRTSHLLVLQTPAPRQPSPGSPHLASSTSRRPFLPSPSLLAPISMAPENGPVIGQVSGPGNVHLTSEEINILVYLVSIHTYAAAMVGGRGGGRLGGSRFTRSRGLQCPSQAS